MTGIYLYNISNVQFPVLLIAASWFDLQAEEGIKDEKVEEENVPCITAGENSELAACYLCHDQFEQFYNEKDEEWQLRNCIEKDKRLYHPMCYDDMVVSLIFYRCV